MPKVALLCEYPTLNGGERSMLATLPGLRAAGFEPVVLCPPDGPLGDRLRQCAVDTLPFIARDERGVHRGQRALRDELHRLLVSHRQALLHANSLAMARLSGPVAAALHLPSIGHLRDILRLPRQAIDDLNAHRRLLAVSAATRAAHCAQGLDAARTQVLHNGVDLEVFCPHRPTGYLHRELGLSADALLAAAIGQIGLRKGLDLLMAAMELLRPGHPHLHLLIVGERSSQKEESLAFERELRAAAARLGHVHFLGWRDDVPTLLNELALLIHGARQEPLGRVLLEGAAAGVPIVATEVGGTREIFPTEAQAAILIPADDPVVLAAAVERVLTDSGLAERLRTSARRRAEQAFDHRAATAALLRHYRTVLGIEGSD